MSTNEMAVDTSVLVASLALQDEHHAKAQPLVRALRTGQVRFHCPTFGPVETCGVLMTKEFGRPQFRLPQAVVEEAWDSLNKWIEQGKIVVYPLTEERMRVACRIAARQQVKGPDAVIVQTALELNLPLETYDRRQARAWERAKGS